MSVLPAYKSVYHICLVSKKTRSGAQIPWNLNYKQLCMLETEFRSSARATRDLNYSAILSGL